MRALLSRLVALASLGTLTFAFGCGGGLSSGGTGPTPPSGSTQNSIAIAVNSGPSGTGFIASDVAFASVTLCVPGTTNCQTIPDVIVDTGSYGLRVLKSALTLPLAQEGNLVECAQFVSFFTWGPVAMADVKMAGEVAGNIPVQVIGDTTTGFPNIPTACQNSAPDGAADTLETLGANGLLGVGAFIQDCGPACVTSTIPGFYYSCPSATTCAVTTVPLAQQVPNPVAMFSTDNNGVLVQLPAITSASGEASASGSLIFGIGTQSNNALGSATIFQMDEFGNFTTTYKGVAYPGSFLDSGSNGIFFLTTALTGMPDCGASLSGFYCPAATTPFSTTTEGTNSSSETVAFSAANVDQLFTGSNTAFNNVTGDAPSCFVNTTTTAPCFDWGLPFFFGRNVFTAIEGQSTPAGPGPYWAF